MNRVKKLSTELLNRYQDKFNVDFQQNKKIIDEIAKVRSKELRNQIAGYIASYINKQTKEQNKKIEHDLLSLEKKDNELEFVIKKTK